MAGKNTQNGIQNARTNVAFRGLVTEPPAKVEKLMTDVKKLGLKKNEDGTESATAIRGD